MGNLKTNKKTSFRLMYCSDYMFFIYHFLTQVTRVKNN